MKEKLTQRLFSKSKIIFLKSGAEHQKSQFFNMSPYLFLAALQLLSRNLSYSMLSQPHQALIEPFLSNDCLVGSSVVISISES